MTLGSSEKAAGSGNSGSALLSNSSSSFKDPFAALAQSSEPWQELDVEAGASCEDSPLPEVQLSQLSIDNEDDTLISSADPAACDFLLVALDFQEQQSSLRKSVELQLEDPVVTVAVGTSSSSNSSSGQLGHTGSSKAGAAAAAAPVGSVGTAGVQ